MRQFKPFFIHFNPFKPGQINHIGPYRAFTARISKADGRNVNVQLTFCTNKDQFCYKKGAWYAKRAHKETMNVFQLSKFLALAHIYLQFNQTEAETMDVDWLIHQYDYVYKNFI